MLNNCVYLYLLVDRSGSNRVHKQEINQFLKIVLEYVKKNSAIKLALSFYNDDMYEAKRINQSFDDTDAFFDIPYCGKTALYPALEKAIRNIKSISNPKNKVYGMLVHITDGNQPNYELQDEKECFRTIRKLYQDEIKTCCITTESAVSKELSSLYNTELSLEEAAYSMIPLVEQLLNKVYENEEIINEDFVDLDIDAVGEQETVYESEEVLDIRYEKVVIEYLLNRKERLDD